MMNEIFEKWGKAARELPPRNEILKSELLTKYPSSPRLPARQEVEKARPSRRLPWLSLALAGAAVVVLVIASKPSTPVIYQGSSAPAASPQVMDRKDSFFEKILPSPLSGSPIADTREFLKTNYYSTLRTRHVADLALRVQTIVRGFGGRVDGQSASDNSGYVSFAVPADKFELFRSEIKTLVGARFYTEQTYAENFLPQKQSIEEQMNRAQSDLSVLYGQRDQLNADHDKAVASIQYQLNAIARELTALRAEVPSDYIREAQINARIQQLMLDDANLRGRLVSENKSYKDKLAALDEQISVAQDNVNSIQKQDQNLIDNVATVSGTISLNWISLWEMADLYLPGPLLAWLLAAAALGAYLYHRRVYIPLP